MVDKIGDSTFAILGRAIVIGGWGDSEGCEIAAATGSSRKLFTWNVERSVEATGNLCLEYRIFHLRIHKPVPTLSLLGVGFVGLNHHFTGLTTYKYVQLGLRHNLTQLGK